MPKVINKRHPHTAENAVYVGRPTKWGNPFSHLSGTLAKYKTNTREEAVEAYERMVLSAIKEDPELLEMIKKELKGKDLICWCAPKLCHADVLLRLANS